MLIITKDGPRYKLLMYIEAAGEGGVDISRGEYKKAAKDQGFKGELKNVVTENLVSYSENHAFLTGRGHRCMERIKKLGDGEFFNTKELSYFHRRMAELQSQ